jgi:multiple sugar transport system permease protein
MEALIVVIVADVWKQSAFMALLILAGLQSIDRELYKVSRVSGATRWQRFKTVTFPLVLPILLVAMMFRMISALWIYGPIATITECNVLPSLSCVVVAAFAEGSFGTASSVAFIQAVIVALVLVVFVLQYARANRGEGI